MPFRSSASSLLRAPAPARRACLAGFVLLAACLLPAVALAGSGPSDWPQWRGPNFDGTSPDADPPVHFGEDLNLAFKIDVPGNGLASPIVAGGRIYLLSAEPADTAAYAESQKKAQEKADKREWPPAVEPVPQRFLVLAYDAATGELLWQRMASEHVPHETHYLDASWASASPVVDGERLYAHFGSNGTFVYDLDGELLWKKDLGDMETRNGFGEGSSPALWQDLLLIAWDHEKDSFLIALDKRTGEEKWRTPRPEERSSWATPLVVDPDGEGGMAAQVVLPGTGKSRGYSATSGEELWSLGGMTMNTIPSAVHRNGMVYLMSGFRGNMLQAVVLAEAEGELEGSKAVRFTHERHTPYVPSPVLDGHRLCFLKSFQNIFTCLHADTGEVLFTEVRLPGIENVYASPVAAGGRIYVFDKGGSAVVLESADSLKVLAQGSLDDAVDASPALVGDSLYVRSRSHLYRFAGEEKPKVEATPEAAGR